MFNFPQELLLKEHKQKEAKNGTPDSGLDATDDVVLVW